MTSEGRKNDMATTVVSAVCSNCGRPIPVQTKSQGSLLSIVTVPCSCMDAFIVRDEEEYVQ